MGGSTPDNYGGQRQPFDDALGDVVVPLAPRDTGPLGIPSMLPVTIGTPSTGGSVTTRGGLVFVDAAAENTLRALDVRT